MRNSRKLAAIVFTDVEGYSALSAQNEAMALRMLDKYRKVISDTTEMYFGKLIHFYGDGSLSIHDNTLDAVKAAIDMQYKFRQDLQIPVRIGIHLGELVEKESSVYGNAVNIASRLQSLGVPNAILVSGSVSTQLSGYPEVECVKLGSDYLKNIKERVDIYAVKDSDAELLIPKWQFIRQKNPVRSHGRKSFILFMIVIGVILLLFSTLLWNNKGESIDIEGQRLMVLPFENLTLDTSLNDIGVTACHYLISGLDSYSEIQVLSFRSILYSNLIERVQISHISSNRRNFLASNVIEGKYYIRNDTLIFHSSLSNVRTGESIINFPVVKAARSEFLNGLQVLLSYIAGYMLSKEQNPLTVPTSDAYKAYTTAIRYWKTDYKEVEYYLKRAIEFDSSFLDAYLLLFEVYYITFNYSGCESVFQLVDLKFNKEQFTERQWNNYIFDKSLIKRDLLLPVKKYLPIYKEDPTELMRNITMANLYLEYANAPKKAIEVLELIPFDSLDFMNCALCLDRIDAAVVANLKLGNLEKAVSLLGYYPVHVPFLRHYEVQALTMAFALDTQQLNRICNNVLAEFGIEEYRIMLYNITSHFKLLRKPELFKVYLDKAFKEYQEYQSAYYGDILIWKGQEAAGLEHFNLMLEALPNNRYLEFRKAKALALLDMHDKALEIINDWDVIDDPYDFGRLQYWQSVVHANLGNSKIALQKLREACYNGRLFRYNLFEFDSDLLPIMEEPEFNEIIHPWREEL